MPINPCSPKFPHGIVTAADILRIADPDPAIIVENLIEAGGISLLIARQKEGKSTLATQLCLDVGDGNAFLGVLKTTRGKVLYIDLENRPHMIKNRLMKLGEAAMVEHIYYAAFQRISDRNVGLDRTHFDNLNEVVATVQPDLIVIDPLRLAAGGEDLTDANAVTRLLHAAAKLQEVCPQAAILLVHHVRKASSDGNGLALHENPREWIAGAYGSQALIAHVETIIGLERDHEGLFTLATVPRAFEPMVLALQQDEESQRFALAEPQSQVLKWPNKQREYWYKLPDTFSWSDALDKGIPRSSLTRLLHRAKQCHLLMQDSGKDRYSKTT